ncbi:MAG: YhdH/YhfP family quinone oxidoreductase [Caldilineaceae bacterium]|nr:YhdH/YhfP family quinone oxidoreductase [Caldilineaceae bacterium]
MTATDFLALVVREDEDGAFVRTVETRTIDELPEGDVLIRVAYSSLNYKDALSATGNRGVTRTYPHTPGIDAAGTVAESSAEDLAPGDEVVIIGYDLGMNTAGGYGQYIRVPADWVVKLPAGLSLHESMVYGTAGFTAAMSVWRLLEAGVAPEQGPVLVTGATGGVGSVAVALLARENFEVVAATGKADQADFLRELGATDVVDRESVTDTSRPMQRTRWAGVVDTVGGDMLATALATVNYGGSVTACGLVGGYKLNTTVYPFILRGVSLLGIDSGHCSIAFRREIWNKLAGDWKLPLLDRLTRTVPLAQLNPEIDRILQGGQVGRVVVDMS